MHVRTVIDYNFKCSLWACNRNTQNASLIVAQQPSGELQSSSWVESL